MDPDLFSFFVGAARNIKSPSFSSLETNLSSSDALSNTTLVNGQMVPYEEPDSNGHSKPTHSEAEAKMVNLKVMMNGLSRTNLLPRGAKDLKRVHFSRKQFSEKQAEQWWAENRTRVYEQYNVRMLDKSSVGIPNEDLAH